MTTDSHKQLPRILCISPLFAPAANSEAFCTAKMVQALRQCGASVTVIYSSNMADADNSRLWDSVRVDAVDIPRPPQPNLWNSLAMTARFQTPLVISRLYTQWVDTVVRTATQLHKENPFDLVYSRLMPMSAHIAGFWCSRKLKLPWIANINDPWEFNFWPGAAPASAVRTQAYLFWLRRTLRTADLMTYPCRGLHEFHCKLAKLDHPAEIIPHIGSRPASVSPKPDDRFRLVHAGKLGNSLVLGRSTKALLLGLKAFVDSSAEAKARTTFVLVGPEDKETQAMVGELGLQGNVETVGRVNYETSLEYISSASACILLEADIDEGIFFASKLSDYLVCGKPVLALSPCSGTAGDLAARGELIRVDHDAEAIRKGIATLYANYERGTLRGPSDRLVAELQGPGVAQQFLKAYRGLAVSQQSEGLQPDRKNSWTRVRHSNDFSQS